MGGERVGSVGWGEQYIKSKDKPEARGQDQSPSLLTYTSDEERNYNSRCSY